MEKGLFGPNRYEITLKIPKNAIKTRGKAEKSCSTVNFVSKWYVIHITRVQFGSHLKNG